MISETHDNYTLLRDEYDDIKNFAQFLATIFNQFDGKNIVVDLIQYNSARLSDLLLFLELSNAHRSTRHSFVIVNAALSIDDIPDELLVVPTLQEATDLIEMEDIERDLGF